MGGSAGEMEVRLEVIIHVDEQDAHEENEKR
jgi:hypothetical protein